MHTSLFLCLTQITAVSLLALILARATLARLPHVSARLSGLGIALSAIITVVSFLPVARPWNVRQILPTFAGSGMDILKRSNSLSSDLSPQESSSHIEDNEYSRGLGMLSLFGVSIGESNGGAVDVRVLPSLATWMLVAVWALLVLRLVYGLHAVVALHRTSHLSRRHMLKPRFVRIANRNGYRDTPVIRESSLIHSPCVTWMQPRVIYIPTSFAEWTTDEQETAIAHELAHALRYDAFYRFWANLFAGLLWFHPLVTLLYRQLKIAQEMAADREGASILGDAPSYSRGLSRLTLRLDASTAPNVFSSLVSVSSHDMIRRIKMLSSMDVSRISQTPWSGHFSAILLIVFGVAAVCFADDEPPIARVATRSTKSPAPAALTKSFSRPTTEPWKAVGVGHGYAMLRPSELAKHDSAQTLVNDITEHVLRNATSPKIGLSFDNVALVQLRTSFELTEHTLHYGADAFDVRSHRPIDWTAASDAIHMAAIAPEQSATVQRARELFGNRGVSDHMRVVSAKQADIATKTTRRLQQVWSKVDGGSIAAAIILGDKVKMPSGDGLDLFSAVDVVAVGIDMGIAAEHRHAVRLACASKADQTADDVISLINDSRQTLLLYANAALKEGGSPAIVALIKDFAGWQVSVERSDNGDNVVVVKGEISSAALAAMFETT